MSDDESELRVPVVEEQLTVARREVDTDRVRVRTVTDTDEVLVEEMLRIGQVDVTRLPVDRQVDVAPEPYRNGDTLIISIVEERLVVEKRLFVVEEVHVTGSSREEAVAIPVSLRRMRAVVERDEPNSDQQGATDGRSA